MGDIRRRGMWQLQVSFTNFQTRSRWDAREWVAEFIVQNKCCMVAQDIESSGWPSCVMPRQPMTRLCGCGVKTRQQKGQQPKRTAEDIKSGIDYIAISPKRLQRDTRQWRSHREGAALVYRRQHHDLRLSATVPYTWVVDTLKTYPHQLGSDYLVCDSNKSIR